MKTIKYFFLFLLLFISIFTKGQTIHTIAPKIINSISKFNCYNIIYNYNHRFHSSEDTSKETIDQTLSLKNGKPTIGFVDINSDYPALTAFNQKQWMLLDKNSGVYYNVDSSKREIHKHKIKSELFEPFFYSLKYFQGFQVTNNDKSYYILERNDTSNERTRIIIEKVIIYISKSTYLPKTVHRWAWFDGGFEYINYELISIKPFGNSNTINNKVDSLILEFKKYKNGDSIELAYRALFKETKVGDSVRNFSGLLHGTNNTLEIDKLNDSIIILDFAFTTCGPCALATPALNKIDSLYKNYGVKLFSINPIKNDWPKIDKFIEIFKVSFPILKVESQVAMDYGVEAYPTIFIIKNGIIQYLHIGSPPNLEEIIVEEIKKLL